MILDFIPNYTSRNHTWFGKSLENDPEYADYYVWRDAANQDEYNADPDNVEPQPPNAWVCMAIATCFRDALIILYNRIFFL